jgi:hypothetical protein
MKRSAILQKCIVGIFQFVQAAGSLEASVHSMEENRFVHLLAHGLKVWIGYHHQQELLGCLGYHFRWLIR